MNSVPFLLLVPFNFEISYFAQNLPVDNPVLIVEVDINRQALAEDDQDSQMVKFTFNKEDLEEVSHQYSIIKDRRLDISYTRSLTSFTSFVSGILSVWQSCLCRVIR